MSLLGNAVLFSPSVEFLLGGCVADTAGEPQVNQPLLLIYLMDGSLLTIRE